MSAIAPSTKGIVRSTGFAVLASAGTAAAAVVVFAGIALLPPSPALGLIASTVLLAAPAAALIAFSTMLARTDDPDHAFWRAGAHGAGALLVGETCEVVWRLELLPEGGILLVAQIVAFVIAAGFGAAAARRILGTPEIPEESSLGPWLDILVVFLGVFVVMLTMLLPSLRSGVQLGYARGLALALMPSLSAALVVYVVTFKRTPWQSWQILATAWIAFLGMKDTFGAIAAPLAVKVQPPGSLSTLLVDGLLVFGYVLAVAAVVERLRVGAPTRQQSTSAPPAIWPALAAPAVLLCFAPIIYVTLSSEAWTQSDVWVVVTVGVGIGLATTARSYIIATENSSLRRHSTTDPLTGLHNHRHFHERLDAEVRRAARAESPLSIAAIDVDDFDRVNNVYGHATGDRRLKSIAERLVAGSRANDIVCRVGGDEFAIVMPETDAVEAYKVCLRLQDYLYEPDDVCPMPISLSIGIAAMPEHSLTAEDLVQRADGALYWAKFHGREQIVIYDSDLVRTLGPEERIERLEEESYVNMVQLLSSAVDARDPYTHHHSRRVAELAVSLAREIGFDDDQVAMLETASLLHDVGKIGVPDSVLRKPDVLDEHERALVNDHPLLAARILGAIPRQEILPWIASHHERWDGHGYPAGLEGDAIPLPSRIIALCDSFDAMTSDRPYRTGLSLAQACVEIRACAGTQFDPTLAARFVAMLEAEHAQARDEAGQPAVIA